MSREIINIHEKHKNILSDFLKQEFEDYSHFKSWKVNYDPDYYGDDSDSSYFEVLYTTQYGNEHSLQFRIQEDDRLEIETSEDCWYEVDNCNYNVKYFWIMVDWT